MYSHCKHRIAFLSAGHTFQLITILFLMISLLDTGLKLNSSIQIKLINFEVFLSDRRKKDWVSWVYSCSNTFCLCFLKLVFKKLYKNSGKEISTPGVF